MRNWKFIIKFSYRNLFRSPKRTFIMVMSLAIGTAFIIWDLNFANSGSKEVMNEFLSQYAGQYQITHPEYYKNNYTKEFDNYKTINDEMIEDQSLFNKSTKRVTVPVFISGEKKTLGVLLTGLEVDKELSLSSLHKVVTEGNFLNALGSKEILLGKKLAEKINVKINDEVVVIGQALDGSVANDLLRVVGLLDFGGGDLEESLAFTQISSAQELLTLSADQYHQRVNFDMTSEKLPKLKNVSVTFWTDLLPEIGVSVKFIDNFTWVVSVVIVLVISLGLSNTLMITFLEREAEFQSLNIIGAQSWWITLTLMCEVIILGFIALMIGTLLGHAVTTYFSYYPINIEIFTGGKPIIMGGMTIKPLVRIYPVLKYYWQVPLMIYFFLTITMIYPLIRVINRSKNAI
jgi:ABC-type lipoprotein release transport system permease subunit